jgi:outer membrane lipoprotein LolB
MQLHYVRPYAFFLLLSCSPLFNGCQQLPKKVAPLKSYNAETVNSLSQLSSFRVSGKVGFRQGEAGGQAKFLWQQTGNDFSLQLMNPFGGEEAHLSFVQGQYSLKLPKEPLQYSDSIESLFKEQLGWPAPIAHLSYWMRGIPLPKMPYKISSDTEGARVLTQDHWTITYTAIEPLNGLPLPKAMILERPSSSDGTARLRMILHWSF